MTTTHNTIVSRGPCNSIGSEFGGFGGVAVEGDIAAAMRGALALLLIYSPCGTSANHLEAISRGLSATHTSANHPEAISRGLSATHNMTCPAGTYFNAVSMACESCRVGTAAEGSAVRSSCGKCKVCTLKPLDSLCALRENE